MSKRDKEDEFTRRQRELDDSFKAILKTREGRLALYWILENCRLNAPSFNPDSSRRTDFNEGCRSVGLVLQNQMHRVNPHALADLLREFTIDNSQIQNKQEGNQDE